MDLDPSAAASLSLPAFRRSDACAAGISDAALRAAIRDGASHAPYRGVYAQRPLIDQERVAAAMLAAGAGHIAIDRTAALIHGLDLFTAAERESGILPVELCALRGSQPTELLGIDGRSRDLAPNDLTTVDGMAVTTPLRTALDLGSNLHRRDAYAALNYFSSAHGITRQALRLSLPRLRGRRGVVQLRQLVELIEPCVESVRESWTLIAMLDAGLPRPQAQWVVEREDGGIYRLDFAYPVRRVAVEYDGEDAHRRTADQVRADRVRRDWLREHGWKVIVVRRGDFAPDRVAQWTAEVERELGMSFTNRRF